MSIENRLAAKKRAEQAKAKRNRNKVLKIVGICLIPVLVCVLGYFIMLGVLKNNAKTDSFLNEDGTIKGKNAKDYVTVCDYKNIEVDRKDFLPKESDVQKAMDAILKEYIETVTTAGTEYADNATVNLTHKVTVDGKEIKDIEYSNAAYELGSNKYTAEFDKKIAALKVGDSYEFDITFSSSFSSTVLAGKKATFKGKVVSMDKEPELTPDFISKNLADEMKGTDFALTAEGFKEYCANELYMEKLREHVEDYIVKNTKVNSYPYFYTKSQYYLADQTYLSQMNYYNAMLGGIYASPVDMLGLESRGEYKKELKKQSETVAAYYLACQAIYEDAGIAKVTDQEIHDYITEYTTTDYADFVKQYGYNYLAQLTLADKTVDYVISLVTENGDASKLWTDDVATKGDATATGSNADAK